MNVQTAINTMRGFFSTQWGAKSTILWGQDDPTPIPNDDEWVRFNILHSEGPQVSIGSPGSNRFRRFGVITLQIFQKEGKYGTPALTLANDAMGIYTGTTDSDIIYRNPILREVGNDGHGWYQINVVINFQYDEIT